MDIRRPEFEVLRRQDHPDRPNAGEQLLELLRDPFSGQLQAASVYSALGISLGFTVFIAILFSFLRPYNQAVYAPKLKHANEKHAPPPLGKAPWSWLTTVIHTREEMLIQQIGLDATIFLRFVRMCRNMFLVLTVVGLAVLVPVHWTESWTAPGDRQQWIIQITPLNVSAAAIWAQVAMAWLFDFVVIGFLWWNYRKILQLRRKYFESDDYQNSLHSRTLMLYDIPRQGCSDEGIARIIDGVAPNSSFARTAIARNVKDLPDLIAQHDHMVRKLEQVLAKYLKNPQQLPPARPTCKPSKKDRAFSTYPRGQKLDAIEYYTSRIRDLEIEIKEVRASVDKRSTMPYGFASYSDISEAHNIAYLCRKKKPHGATVTLAPRPNDVIWTNMPLSSAARSRRRWINALWVALLTFFWIAPNAMIAIFLVNLSNLGKVWPAFNRELAANTTFWGIVQGIASPALTSLFYLALPVIFRRLSIKAGDQTKTGRERHVLAKLYSFFIFNNLVVFSIFSTAWGFVAGVIDRTNDGSDAWRAILDENIALALVTSLCRNSPFWVTYLLQRQLGAAIDLAQIWPLIYAFFLKKFSSPTPRELIELTAPPPFEYASYYNYFLFYATVTLCFAGIQPLVLLATAMYFSIDAYLKKYLLLYRFVTKTESGGVFWRVIFNRFIFAAVLANLVTLLVAWAIGEPNHLQFYAVCPLPFIMVGFKLYCSRMFDDRIRYYSIHSVGQNSEAGQPKESRLRSEKLASRFGHPALYKPLITPMVHQKAQNLLPSVYSGRLTDGREVDGGDLMTVSGYSDVYALSSMQGGQPGKSANGVPGFEYVSESHMDFEYYKNRAEFVDDRGGNEMYGRPDTPASFGEGSEAGGSRPGTPLSGRARTPFGAGSASRADTGYHAFRPPAAAFDQGSRTRSPLYAQENTSSSGLVGNAAAPPLSISPVYRSPSPGDYGRGTPGTASPRISTPGPGPGPSVGAMGGGPQGYSGLAQGEIDTDPDPMQYDYFRGTRPRREPGSGW
ncbi:hypothetical protein S40285_02386 [Stachybotrys chlorohalonatus IBT 40285]|uniref:CSC1/OSCA1-like 7TM region domain-containing protein n=1 Tax=Stachybotrys chlorohalonatus (strain IBT 40285) TaxID=1283841 RepID=A0A084QPR0_STAC4|nr:hypothetical protein S40285_02386 [Stachybotrys chlorohalonata IBT 40285]